jgi:Bacteriophage head to tail connecting protein
MSDGTAKDLISRGDQLFNKKTPILSLWQAQTEQFYPESADYTYTRSIGMEFASHLMTGSPAMASRDLANAISAMCRPPGQTWVHPRTGVDSIDKDITNLRWLDNAGATLLRAFYSFRSGFRRATAEGDRDFSCIGNACIRYRPNNDFTGLSFRARHMRDVAFDENYEGYVDEIHVKDQISVRSMIRQFPKTVSQKVKDREAKDPFQPIQVRHVVMPADEYDGEISKMEAGPNGIVRRRGYPLPWVSVIFDVENETVLEEIGQYQFGYVTPRWSTKPGFGYGYSPASVINIADARMLQQITLTLLEAGQKAVDPPMKAVGNDAIQGGVNAFAGGISWVDPDYDERTGQAISPLYGPNAFPQLGWGVDREDRIEKLIRRGHFLDQIKFPDTSKARTAYETQKMWEEFIRSATPLFEPIASEYNGPLCDGPFTMLLRLNAFGPIRDIPRALRGKEIHFEFESPLTIGQAAALAQTFTSVGQITQLATAMDPTVRHDLDIDTAYRDALTSAGAPATWLVTRAKADALKDQDRQQQAAQQATEAATQQIGNAADAAGKIGNAAALLQNGGVIPPQQSIGGLQ